MTRRWTAGAALFLLLPAAGACRDAAAGAGFAGSIDTLASGVVHVRNPATGMWKPGEEWTLVEELRIGSEDSGGPEMFGAVAALEVDPAGRIYVLEPQAMEIRVFDAAGRHLRTMGRKGGGPGELDQVAGLQWDPKGRLWTLDQANGRFSVFDTTGAFVTSHRRGSGLIMSHWLGGITRDGQVLVPEMRIMTEGNTQRGMGIALVRYDSLAQPRDTFAIPEYDGPTYKHTRRSGNSISSMTQSVPFSPGMSWTLDPDGYVWAGVSDRYRLACLSLSGDTVRVVEREWVPAPVTSAERDASMERLKGFRDAGGTVDLSRIPVTKPAFSRITVDNHAHLWVKPELSAAEDGRVLDVFDAEGRYLGAVRGPDVLGSPLLVRDDRLYTVVRDEMDLPYVVRYRIQGREV